MLIRKFGIAHLDLIEDAVQTALLRALESWTRSQSPDNPAAWLYQVAYRTCLSHLDATQRREALLLANTSGEESQAPFEWPPLHLELNDALLKMLFISCDDSIPTDAQLVFTLKALCGFNVREIALRLFISEDNAYKRYARAKEKLKAQNLVFDDQPADVLRGRLSAVQYILYSIFTEGYLTSHSDNAIRKDLCEEAMRLTALLDDSHLGQAPSTTALLALMHFHYARLASRENEEGELILLEEQTRTDWDPHHIHQGLSLLEQSATGDAISRFHIEANIAARHCMSPSFATTDWQKIVESYTLLERIAPSPMHTLNKAIALAQWQGAAAGLRLLKETTVPSWLEKYYHWHAVLADLHFRCNKTSAASDCARKAMASAPSDHIRDLLSKRFSRYDKASRN